MASDPLGYPVSNQSAGRSAPPPGPRAGRQGRLSRPGRLRWLLAALLLLPLLELAVAIEVGRHIGPLVTIGLLLLSALVGAVIVRRQGALAWRTLNTSLQAGTPPSRELANAAAKLLTGVLLIVPGFVTDVLALLLLFPLTRPVLSRPLQRALDQAAANQVTLLRSFPGQPFAGSPFGGGDVVEGQVIVEAQDLPSAEDPRT